MTGVCQQRNKRRKGEQQKTHRKIAHNYTTYTLSDEQYEALSFGLDTQILVKVDENAIYIEFEIFFKSLLKDISNIPENELRQVKTNLRITYDKIIKRKYHANIEKLSKNYQKEEILQSQNQIKHGLLKIHGLV